jgi:hypothetical protein
MVCSPASQARAADDKGPLIGDVRIRTMAPVTYAYVTTQTTFDKLGDAIGTAMGDIQKAAADGKIKVAGSFVLTYPDGSSHLTPDKPFKVHIGFLIEEGAGAGEVKVRKTEPFKAATLLYTGRPADMGQCYPKLFAAIREMGLEPSGEEREFTTYWEGMDSPNNVMLVQVGVKDKQGAPNAANAPAAQPLDRAVTAAAAAAPAPQAQAGPALSPELKVLDRAVGAWDQRYTIKPGPWHPEEVTGTGSGVVKWAIGGRFMQVTSTLNDGTEAMNLVTYDPQRGEYRNWYFNSAGNTSETVGQWDPASQTMTWTGDAANGMKLKLTDRWVGEAKRRWTVEVKDDAGKVMFEMDAEGTRRK